MRLTHYLNENDIEEYTTLISNIEDKCSQYLKSLRQSKNANNLLFSGRKKKDKWFEGFIRTNRQPRDTPPVIHDMIDDVFQQEFGIRLRSNSLFCINSLKTARTYGNIYYIFPIGDYNTWYNSNVQDLYAHFNKYSVRKELDAMGGLNAYEPIMDNLENEPDYKDRFKDYLERLIKRPYGYRKGLPDNPQIEVMVTGSNYYGINYDWVQQKEMSKEIKFMDWLWGNL